MLAFFLSIVFVLVSPGQTFFRSSEKPVGTFPHETLRANNVYFTLNGDEVFKCRKQVAACDDCMYNCKFRLSSLEVKNTMQTKQLLTKIDTCQEAYEKLKAYLPEWCTNKGLKLTSVFGYGPTNKQCSLMSKLSCAQKWVADVRNNMGGGDRTNERELEIAIEALKHAEVLRDIEEYRLELDTLNDLLQKYEDERNDNILSQAQAHIANPSENRTVFAHPIYANLEETEQENRHIDDFISNHDIYVVGLQNQAVRKQTIYQIPNILNAISKLESRIHSKKDDTDGYIQDIKDISTRIAGLQKNATNLKFEKTHSSNVDDAIGLLDNEMYDLLQKLRNEESVRIQANKQATHAKLQLMAVLRGLVQEISTQQLKTGCDTDDVISP